VNRLLIVSPHFPPVNAPDMQRVRMSLPYFVAAGWEVTVLAADDPDPIPPVEAELLATIPAAVRVVRVPCLGRRWLSRLGINNLGWRVLPGLFRTGNQIIRAWRPDVVYFSTTQFITLPLGRIWRRRFDVPYVVDLQDPWVSDFYRRPGAPRPPGGWKYGIAAALAALLEGWTLRRAAHVLSVSPAYLEAFARRYRWWQASRGSVLTFGAPEADFAHVRQQHGPRVLPPPGPNLRIAYAGRLGPDMVPALDILFAAAARWKDEGRAVELCFYGTSYAGEGSVESTTTARARHHGIAHLVQEHPRRIGYLASLQLLLETDVALLLGSGDEAYSPSKIYPTLLAGKPTLAIAPAGGALAHILEELGGAALVAFDPAAGIDGEAVAAVAECLGQARANPTASLGKPLDGDRLRTRYSAAAVARRQIEVFAAACTG